MPYCTFKKHLNTCFLSSSLRSRQSTGKRDSCVKCHLKMMSGFSFDNFICGLDGETLCISPASSPVKFSSAYCLNFSTKGLASASWVSTKLVQFVPKYSFQSNLCINGGYDRDWIWKRIQSAYWPTHTVFFVFL